jgi:hypothetical protein
VGLAAIVWEGQAWIPRVSVKQQRPYANYWSPSPNAVYVDTAGRLHIWIRKVNNVWTASEIRSVKTDYGYGSYTFVVETPISQLDPNEALGMFTYNSLPPPKSGSPKTRHVGDERYIGHQETDFEIGRWKWIPRKVKWNGQYVVQPYWPRGHLQPVLLPKNTAYTARFTWGPHSTLFQVWRGKSATGRPVSTWRTPFTNGAPRTGCEVALETWLGYGLGPATGQDHEVVIDSFTYVPRS